MYYEDESGQLNIVKPEKKKEEKPMHRYTFTGNVYINDILVGVVENMETEAVSLKKAINNIKHRIKKRYGHADKGCYVSIDASQVKRRSE
jgi:hypothetical protein